MPERLGCLAEPHDFGSGEYHFFRRRFDDFNLHRLIGRCLRSFKRCRVDGAALGLHEEQLVALQACNFRPLNRDGAVDVIETGVSTPRGFFDLAGEAVPFFITITSSSLARRGVARKGEKIAALMFMRFDPLQSPDQAWMELWCDHA